MNAIKFITVAAIALSLSACASTNTSPYQVALKQAKAECKASGGSYDNRKCFSAEQMAAQKDAVDTFAQNRQGAYREPVGTMAAR